MRQETEKTFDYVVREDRSLLELIDCDYTFLNEKLAKHYGLTNLNVKGDEMRLVQLPADSSARRSHYPWLGSGRDFQSRRAPRP